MGKIPLWQRVGGWLRRSHDKTHPHPDTMDLDSEGMLIDGPADQLHPANNALAPNHKDRQMAAMEEGFSRLVTVLESINDNAVQQRRQGAEIRDLALSLPKALENQQQMVKELTEHMGRQSVWNQQLADAVGALPELTQQQLEKLGEITTELQASGQTGRQMTESFGSLDQSMTRISQDNQSQAASLTEVTQLLAQNDRRLDALLGQQKKRTRWLLAAVLILGIAALAALIAAVLIYRGQPAPTVV